MLDQSHYGHSRRHPRQDLAEGALTHLPLHIQGPVSKPLQTNSGGLAAVAHLLIKRHGACVLLQWVLRCPRGPRERRLQGGAGRGMQAARGGGDEA